jgi:uncharacterized protein with beta-barrel porin domain
VSALLRSASTFGIVAGIGALLPATPARADCQPDPASSGQTVICTGVDHDGFVAGAGVNNLDVRVRANATVHDNGVVAIGLNNRNTVDNKGTIVSNGFFGIAAGNRNTITNSNEILVGATAAGIFVGNQNTVSNNGDITVGTAGVAMFGGTANTFSNAGTINLGLGGTGIEMLGLGGDTVVNSGMITGAASTIGILSLGSHSTITNDGTIMLGKANPSPSIGILINDHTTLTNNNLIQVGVGGEGIEADGAHNRIFNNGMITAGTNGVGILTGVGFLGGDNHIINTGTISTHGIFADAIVVENGGTVFNSGTIANTTPGGTAIDFCSCSTGYKLTIAPTSVITGLVTATGNDTFQLGGTGNGSFDLSSIGPTKQYEGFGVFNVVSGFWTVSKVFGQSDAWNVIGGTLSGTGTLADLNVDAGGTLQPGTTPGTAMKITGNLAFQSGALYVVTLNGTTSTLANVSGTASLAGGVEALLQVGVTKQTYTILHSGGLGGTTFDSLTVAPGFTGTLTYTPTDVLLGLNANLGLGGGLNINQQNVANALNNFFNAGGALPAGFLSMFNLTGGNLQNALTQLSGEANVDGEATTFQQMTQFLSLMLDPFVAGRNGIGGGSGALGFAPEQEANFPSDIALAYDAILKAPPPKPATLDQRWTAWGTAYGGSDKTNGDPAVGSNTFTANTFGFAAGMDYHPAPDTILGFALAGGGTNWTLAQALGGGRSDAFQAGVYGTKYFGPAYLAGSLAFANNWMTTNRTALGDQLTSSFNAQSVGGRVEAGYRYAVQPAIGVTPYGALQAQNFHTPSRSEIDLTGGGFGLSFAAMNATDTRSELGARVDGLTTLNGLPLILRGRLAWAHDWVSNPALSAVFQGLPGASFVVNGAPLPANSALASAGAELKLNPHVSLLGKFDGEFANSSQTYAGTGTLRYTW